MAVPNYGLLTDIAGGLREGLIDYQTINNAKRNQQRDDLVQGIQDGPNGPQFTPEKQAQLEQQRNMAKLQNDQQMSEYDPNSAAAQRGFQVRKNAGLIVPEGASLHEQGEYDKVNEFAQGQQTKKMLAQLLADRKSSKPGADLTPGQLAADRDFGKEYNEWNQSGKAGVDKNLTRLHGALDQLEADKNKSSLSGRFTGLLPNFLRSTESKTIQQDVQAAAQASLKQALGSQFTEKEGERIMNAAYDPSLPPEENIKKINNAIDEIESIKQSKDARSQQFQKQGTLFGLPNEGGEGQAAIAQPKTKAQSGQDADAAKFSQLHNVDYATALNIINARRGGAKNASR